MTKQELKDKAMLIASGEYLIESFTFDEFGKLSNEDFENSIIYAYQDYEPAEVSGRIMDLYDVIMHTFEGECYERN